MARLDLVTLVVESFDPAIEFYVEKLGFELVEDSPAVTSNGHPKRWVVVRPPGGHTGVMRDFGFQRGLIVASSAQSGFPA